jgi:hypothetical protein
MEAEYDSVPVRLIQYGSAILSLSRNRCECDNRTHKKKNINRSGHKQQRRYESGTVWARSKKAIYDTSRRNKIFRFYGFTCNRYLPKKK